MFLRFTTENGSTENTDFIVSTYRRNEIYHNGLNAAENTINATLPFSTELAEFIKTHSDEDVKAELIDDTSILATGYLRKTFSFEKNHRNQPITVQIVSPAFILDKELAADQKELCESNTYLQLLNKLLQKAGFYSSDRTAAQISDNTDVQTALAKVCDVALFDESENIKTLIAQIAFELGTVYDFDNSGDFKLFPLFNESETVTQTFDDNNIVDNVTLEKQESECDNVCLKWQKKEYHEDSLIFSDTSSGNDTHKCEIDIAAGEYFGGEETYYLEYDSDYGEVICNKQITKKDVEGTIDTATFKTNLTDSGTSAEISYQNTSSQDQQITKLDVYGDVWVKVRGENQTKATEGDNSKDYSIRFLNSDDDVSALALKLVAYYRYSDYTITLSSRADYAVGSFVTVDSEGIGNITARVVQKTTYINDATDYVLEAVSEYSAATIKTKSVKNNGAVPVHFTDVVYDKFASVEEEVDNIKVPVIVKLYKRAEQKPETTGISSDAVFNYEDGALTWNNTSGSNGWTINEPDGTDPIYLTAASISGKSTVTIPASAWSDPVILVKNGENGANSAEVYNIVPDYNLVTRYSDNTLSAEEVTFKFYKANESSRGEISVYYKIYGSQLSGIWSLINSGSGTSVTVSIGEYLGFRCDIFDSEDSAIPLDSETVMVVAEGSGGIVVDLSNNNVSIPCDSDGNPTSYADTQTIVYVLSGATPLNYGSSDTPGYFSVDIAYDNVEAEESESGSEIVLDVYQDETEETYTDESGSTYKAVSYFTLPDISKLTSSKGKRTITVKGVNFDGTAFEISTDQSFTKVYAGKNGKDGTDGTDGKDGTDGTDGSSVILRSVAYAVSDNIEDVPSSWSETRPTEIEQGYYLWTRKIYYDEKTESEKSEYSYAYEGKDGNGITSIVDYYLISASSSGVTRSTKGWVEKTPSAPTALKPYLWNYETITTDQEVIYTEPGIIGNYAANGADGKNGTDGKDGADGKDGTNGTDGRDGTDGRGIETIAEYYESNTTSDAPAVIDKTDIKDVTFNQTYCYLFNKTVTAYTDGTSDTVTRIIAVYGQNGENGYNTATVVLYKRSASTPTAKPTANLIYTFSKPPVITWASEGSSNGWTLDKPAVTVDKWPLYEIRATAISNTSSDTVKPSEWSEIVQSQMDNGLTEAEVNALIETSEENIMESLVPDFSIDADSNRIAVDENGIVTRPQTITVTVNCKRNGKTVPFKFSNVTVADGFIYTLDDTKIKVTVKAGEVISNGNFSFKVTAADVSFVEYIDENGENYIDDESEKYSQIEFDAEEICSQSFTVNYIVVQGGAYLHSVSSVSDIPADAVMNDYFTWSGAITKSNKSISGEFRTSAVYTFDGEYWVEEKNSEHLSRCLSDILGIADSDLEQNNSSAYEYLDHLTANDIFAKKVVTKLVEAELIISKEEISDKFISIDSDISGNTSDIAKNTSDIEQNAKDIKQNAADLITQADSALTRLGLKLDKDRTIISGSKITTGLIDAEALLTNLIAPSSFKISQSNVDGLTQKITAYDELKDTTIPAINETLGEATDNISGLQETTGTLVETTIPAINETLGEATDNISDLQETTETLTETTIPTINGILDDATQNISGLQTTTGTLVETTIPAINETLGEATDNISDLQETTETLTETTIPEINKAIEKRLLISDAGSDITDYHTIYCKVAVKEDVPTAPSEYITADTTTWKLNAIDYEAGYVVYSCVQYKFRDETKGIRNTPVAVDSYSFFDVAKGVLRTKLIETDEIKAVLLTVDNIQGISGVFDNIESDSGIFTNAEVTGKLNATELSVVDSISVGKNFTLDKNGNLTVNNGNFNGKINSDFAIFEQDISFPGFDIMQISANGITNFTLDLEKTSATEIKNIFDKMLDSSNGIAISAKNDIAKRIYINITSGEEGKYVHNTLNSLKYLERTYETEDTITYISYRVCKLSYGFTDTHRLVLLYNPENGDLFKYTSSYDTVTNILQFNYISDEAEFMLPNTYFSGTIESLKGYAFHSKLPFYGISNDYKKGTMWSLCNAAGIEYIPRMCAFKKDGKYSIGSLYKVSSTEYDINVTGDGVYSFIKDSTDDSGIRDLLF